MVSDFPHRQKELSELRKSKSRIVDTHIKNSVKLELQETREILKNRGILILKVVANKSLILGDEPQLRMNSRGTGHLNDEKTELWFPIAHDVAVSPGSTNAPKHESLFKLGAKDTAAIRRLNRGVFGASSEVACRSYSLLHSLLKETDFKEYADIKDRFGSLKRKSNIK